MLLHVAVVPLFFIVVNSIILYHNSFMPSIIDGYLNCFFLLVIRNVVLCAFFLSVNILHINPGEHAQMVHSYEQVDGAWLRCRTCLSSTSSEDSNLLSCQPYLKDAAAPLPHQHLGMPYFLIFCRGEAGRKGSGEMNGISYGFYLHFLDY